jgi:hypothetical protein
MSNIGNKLRSGFFATPEQQGQYLVELFNKPKGLINIFDPTCGEGRILKQIAKSLESDENQIQTYGVEVDKARCKVAMELLDYCSNAAIETMVVQRNAFQLIYLNPPYDFEMLGADDLEGAKRKEFIELERATRYLADEGIMCYVIPSYRFAAEKVARFISTHFEKIAVVRFSDEDYDDYKQCVIIARKRSSDTKKFINKKVYNFLINMDDEEFVLKNVRTISSLIGKLKWDVPAAIKPINIFYSKLDSKDNYYEGIINSSGFEQFIEQTKPREISLENQPIINLNSGQLALLMASGFVNGMIGNAEDLHIVQGQEIVSKETEVEQIQNEDGSITEKNIERTVRKISIKTLSPNGFIKKLVCDTDVIIKM